ncbi:hypothetical protein TTHERM_000463139 (macronuclear) [Tetrahymena thermophila SB210]|uniref:Uncharacterized protein n=1 Tax=Tetrahymena thermophila (strain SB210) TaxID=312017 RepID=W7X8M4_TETTS|nr:hypothetical protein TTHERM_000463139 [Tetrahymena thermophila SB210]EWS73702.1 hypothetical protein TTHERM_000463139 [Tetrahymena thermophila SB210]|eukprot:XP_012653740.1 hypothetical protein TTHERM_000463139 [Tetrahymena thermophila SB210]
MVGLIFCILVSENYSSFLDSYYQLQLSISITQKYSSNLINPIKNLYFFLQILRNYRQKKLQTLKIDNQKKQISNQIFIFTFLLPIISELYLEFIFYTEILLTQIKLLCQKNQKYFKLINYCVLLLQLTKQFSKLINLFNCQSLIIYIYFLLNENKLFPKINQGEKMLELKKCFYNQITDFYNCPQISNYTEIQILHQNIEKMKNYIYSKEQLCTYFEGQDEYDLKSLATILIKCTNLLNLKLQIMQKLAIHFTYKHDSNQDNQKQLKQQNFFFFAFQFEFIWIIQL